MRSIAERMRKMKKLVVKSLADKIKDYIDRTVEGHSPLSHTERDMERYLRGVVNGAWFWSHDQQIYREFRDDIIKDLDQDNLEEIERLKREIEHLREMLRR